MNTFMNGMTNATNYARTENGALAHKSTNSAVYDMFAVGGAYRKRSDEDCQLLFKNAYEEDKALALKCLFYLRDCRGGQGERRFFRVAFNWLAKNDTNKAIELLDKVSEFGRWDDVIYSVAGTPAQDKAFAVIKHQLALDIECKTPSLLAKWMPSENASSAKTKEMANKVREYLGMSHKEYRKTLSILRERINVLERLMSAGRWDEIEFDKIPSKAGLVYRNAFARRDILAKKYENFMKDEKTTVNAGTLYPYEIVEKVLDHHSLYGGWRNYHATFDGTDVERAALNKYWENQIDYLNGEPCSMMCMIDTSDSMSGRPIQVATSLGLYCAERLGGPFKDHFVSFASRPQFIKTEGVDFVDKVLRIVERNLCDDTNLIAAFNLLKSVALRDDVKREDIPKTLVVISDMQINSGTSYTNRWTEQSAVTEMEKLRVEWAEVGLELPKLVYWNVDARGDANILDAGPNVSFVSGCSPVIFKSVLTGKTGYDLMLEVLLSERYAQIG